MGSLWSEIFPPPCEFAWDRSGGVEGTPDTEHWDFPPIGCMNWDKSQTLWVSLSSPGDEYGLAMIAEGPATSASL